VFSLFWGSVQKRVARGVTLLDAYDPEWFNRVDTDRLHMEHNRLCILAQVVGPYYEAALKTLGLSPRKGMKYGFDGALSDDFYAPWNELRREWVRVITLRRAQQMDDMLKSLDRIDG
jgi:hypothetical protein